ncbi:MAG: ribosomal RNA small subunit methyltransferase A [Firmicutes bacterium]|nr:ribosomal RNA small subunit methyltransferase A [Candidatus Caballimonas caccae]
MENGLKQTLTKYGFAFKKAYGQNFLTDEKLLESIVINSGVNSDTTVLEIGCGAGALTKQLSKRAKKVVGYEIDLKLKPILEEVLDCFSNTEIVYKDIMKENLSALEEKLGKDYIMVANLPYYITTPIILEFLEKAKNIKAMIIMVQEEVAYRLTAKEGTADYGAITVAIKIRGESKIIERVGREKFTPIPNVDSAVVKIDIDREKYKGIDYKAVRDLVRCAFNNRRKTFVNNLMKSYNLDRENATSLLESCGASANARGETLSDKQFVILSNKIKEYL